MTWYLGFLQSSSLFDDLLEVLAKDPKIGKALIENARFFNQLSSLIKSIKPKTERYKGPLKTIESEMSGQFPPIPSTLIYPSMEQLKEKPSRSETALRKPLIYIRSIVPNSLRIFSSKDKPFMVKFMCSDDKERALMFKLVQNSSLESIMSNVFSSAVYLEEITNSRPLADEYLGLHKSLALYNIQPIGPTILVLEFMQGVETVSDFIKREIYMRSTSESDSRAREVLELFKNYFELMYAECDHYDWFSKKVLVNYSYGFWSIIGAIFGVGDRNLRNIMVGRQKGFTYIDFEIMLGLGKNLPVPETVKLRVGPLFSRFPGILRTKELFRSVMVAYYTWVKENIKELMLQFSELLCHQGEQAFFSKAEFYSEKVMKESLVDFFLEAEPNDYDQVSTMIAKEEHPNAQKYMYGGWDPTL